MGDYAPNNNRPLAPRRRKRSKLRIFKESYLPLIIAAIALLLILLFIIGSVSRTLRRSRDEKHASLNASIAAAEEHKRLTLESQKIYSQATILAASFDYDGAINLLDSFDGNISDFPQLDRLYQQYLTAKSELVIWDDPTKVLNLSFQMLIADPSRAFENNKYGSSFLKNYITVDEFSRILQQTYENGYILVSLSDLVDGTSVEPLYLPPGKKPLILTQTQVNYYTYMTDGDGDNLPDKDGAGFASKLLLDANGNLTCEMVTASGETVTGAFDLVPILESFIATHPDFSYKGARAILAVTGYDGILGYRITESAKARLSEEAYQKEIEGAVQTVQALREAGYTIACGTYENAGYGSYSASKIKKDLTQWANDIKPILGDINILVYARNSDIATAGTDYSGEKFKVLQDFGFTRYLGFCANGNSWFLAKETYIRQGRILITGNNLNSRSAWFTGIFDPDYVLDEARRNYKS